MYQARLKKRFIKSPFRNRAVNQPSWFIDLQIEALEQYVTREGVEAGTEKRQAVYQVDFF